MIQLTKLLISKGEFVNSEVTTIEESVKVIKNSREWLHSQKIDDILEYVEMIGKHWSNNFENKIGTNSPHVKNFLSKSYLSEKLDIALHGDKYSLDNFVDLGDSELLFHAQPRGVACHWIAGNVDILGIFSAIQSLLTKNVSIIKVPSNYTLLVDLLTSLENINTEKISGKKMLECFEVLYIEQNDEKNQKILSVDKTCRAKIAQSSSFGRTRWPLLQ